VVLIESHKKYNQSEDNLSLKYDDNDEKEIHKFNDLKNEKIKGSLKNNESSVIKSKSDRNKILKSKILQTCKCLIF